ncbi:MAG TPA: TonB-dependent receptor [Pyrinomonadaceae bacterium]|nr:TonB-dependent receptor [Pyrinomonadaceae bacterium]
MKYRIIVLAVLLTTLLSISTLAQSGSLTGVVEDSTGSPIAGATVVVRNTKNRSERTVTTDSEGRFTIVPDCGDSCEIVVSANGFASSTIAVASAQSSVDVTLEPSVLKEQVTVTATRTEISTNDTTVSVSVVDREKLDRQGLNTVGDIFRTLPGTSTVNEGAFQVRPRIRGLDSNRVLILVDGERLNNSRTSTGQSGIETGLVDLGQIETVEVVRGGGSVLYGTDALAGTINIITQDTPPRRENGFRFGGTLDTFYTSNENGRRGTMSLNGAGKFFAFRISQSMDRFDNYFAGDPSQEELDALRAEDLQITDEGEVLNSQSHSSNTQGTFRFFLNDTNTLKFNYERRRAGNIGSAGLTGPNTGDPNLVGVFNAYFPFNNRDKFNVRYDVAALTENLQRITAKAFYQTQHRNFTNSVTVGPIPPFFPGVYQFSETVTDTKTAGFDLQTDWIFGRHNVVAGASWFKDDNTDRRLLIQASTPSSANRTVRNTRSVPDASLSNLAFFAQDDFRVTKRLRIVGGIRFDRFLTVSDPTPEFALDPRFTPEQIEQLGLTGLTEGLDLDYTSLTGDIGAVYSLTKNVNLSARLGRSFRAPNISERFFTDPGSAEGFLVGNPDLEPETGINFDTSVKVTTSRVRASATYFNNFFENFLATQLTGVQLPQPPPRAPVDVYQTRNVRKARIQGFEAEIEVPFKISVGYLTPYGNFSYLRGDDVDRDVPLDFISPFRTNIGFNWQNFGKNYYVDYNARFVGEQERLSPEFLESNGGPEPGFVTHSLSGGYYFRRERFDLSINLGISNLADAFYSEQFVFAPARGRSFTIGTKIEIK